MHTLMKSDEEPPEIINESIYENLGICHKEDILPLHEPHTMDSYLRRMERVLLSRISKRQRNSMVSLRMCSVKMNTPRSRFWIGLHLS